MGYALIVNPYHALFVDVVGGAIFPLFYASLTAFANTAAAPGTSATMQCLFGATFEGLGKFTGCTVDCGGLEHRKINCCPVGRLGEKTKSYV